jgi:O-antigen/teichoic acid export membrane protein
VITRAQLSLERAGASATCQAFLSDCMIEAMPRRRLLASSPVAYRERRPGLDHDHSTVDRGEGHDLRYRAVQVLKRFAPWAMKGGFAVLGQGLVSGCNFVVSILLARWLLPGQYGAFAVAYAVFLLFTMLYQSLLTEPMSVFGASSFRECMRGYFKSVLFLHLASALVVLITLSAAAEAALKIARGGGLPGALAGFALAGPVILAFGLARRMFYVDLSTGLPACGAAVYCGLTISALFLAHRYHWLSPMSAVIMMGFGALCASFLLFTQLNFRLPPSLSRPSLRTAWSRHWKYGRWALAAAAMSWIPSNIFYPLVSAFFGMVQAGELKAVMNFILPIGQTYAALSTLLLPYAAGIISSAGWVGAEAMVRRVTWLCTAGGVGYWALVLLLRGPLFRVLYSGRYTDVMYLLPVAAVGSVCWSAFIGPATVLRAMESPNSVFVAVGLSSSIAFAVGLPATWAFGVRGAVWAMTLSEGLAFAAAFALARRKLRAFSDAARVASSSPGSASQVQPAVTQLP